MMIKTDYLSVPMKRLLIAIAMVATALVGCGGGGGTNSIISDLPSAVMNNSYLIIVTTVVVVEN